MIPQKNNSASVLLRPIAFGSLGFVFLMFMLPVYGKSMGANALAIGGLFSAFTATSLFFRPLIGWALDRFGRKPFFITALCGYTIAMILFALANSMTGLYIARVIQGIAASFLWISINTIATDLSTPRNRGMLLGRVNERVIRGGIYGAVIGFTLISLLTLHYAWQLAFVVYAIFAAIGAAMAIKNVPETKPEITLENHTKLPFSKQILKLLVIVFTTGVTAAMISPIYLIYLQDKFTTNVVVLAIAFLPAGIVYSLFPSRLGSLSDRFGRAPMMAGGLVAAGILSLVLPHLPNLFWLIVFYTLATFGWAMADPAEAAMVADLTHSEMRGRGYGVYDFTRNLGMSIGPLLGGWLYDTVSHTIPFYLNGIVLLVSAAWIILLLRKPVHP